MLIRASPESMRLQVFVSPVKPYKRDTRFDIPGSSYRNARIFPRLTLKCAVRYQSRSARVTTPDIAISRQFDKPLTYNVSSPPHHAANNTMRESSFVAQAPKLAQIVSWLFETIPTSSWYAGYLLRGIPNSRMYSGSSRRTAGNAEMTDDTDERACETMPSYLLERLDEISLLHSS